MTLQDRRDPVALADHGNFGRAEAACHTSQSTLSTPFRKRERLLRVPLFERTGKAFTPTAVGAGRAARLTR